MAEETRKKRAPTAAGKKKAGRAKSKAGGTRSKAGRAKGKAGRAKSKAGRAKSQAGATRSKARAKSKAPGVPVLVAVFETAKSHRQRAHEVIEALGYQLAPESTEAEICERIAGAVPPDVVLVAASGGAKVLDTCRVRTRQRPVTIAALAGPATTALGRCNELDADLFVLRPHSRDSLSPALHAATALAAERQKVKALESRESVLHERLQRYGEADAITGFQHFDFFKQLLVMELKRARRYGYSLAACLVAIDPWNEERPEPPPETLRKLRTRVATVIAACIRDIDLPVDFADDRFLAFLPYTDLDGAERVGRRIAKAVKSFGSTADGRGCEFTMSISIGIAALRPGKPISFARIMRDAGAAVRVSQLKGGGHVVVRK